MEIRYMREEDISAVAAIEKDSIPQPWSESSFRAALENPQAICLVCDLETDASKNRILGYAVIYYAADEGELVTIAVHPLERGKHIASDLLKQGHAVAKEKGAASVYLEVRKSNLAAKRLYESFAYEVCGERKNFYSDPVEDALLMKLSL